MPTVYVSSQEDLNDAINRLKRKISRERIGREYDAHACFVSDKQKKRQRQHKKEYQRERRRKSRTQK